MLSTIQWLANCGCAWAHSCMLLHGLKGCGVSISTIIMTILANVWWCSMHCASYNFNFNLTGPIGRLLLCVALFKCHFPQIKAIAKKKHETFKFARICSQIVNEYLQTGAMCIHAQHLFAAKYCGIFKTFEEQSAGIRKMDAKMHKN